MITVTQLPSPSERPSAAPSEPIRARYRIRFAKTGLLRWISHRDLARLWERLLRRTSLRLSMTEGFHPKPRVGFPSALALGVEGMDEVVELELAEELLPNELLDRLQSDNQPGLIILSVSRLPEGFGKAQLKQSDYVINLPPSADLETTQLAIERLKSQETVSVLRKGKTITANVQSQIPELAITQSLLHLSLTASDSASLRPGDVLDLLGIGDSFEQGAMITRTRVTLHREFESDDPNQVALAKATQLDENAVSEQDDA